MNLDDDTRSLDSFSSSLAPSQLEKCRKENSFIVFERYLLQEHVPDMINILLQEEANIHYALKINGTDFLEKNISVTDALFFDPEKTLKCFNNSLYSSLCKVYEGHPLKSHMLIKPYLHVRLSKLPICPEIWRERVPKSNDIGNFLAVMGTVIRTCSAKILEHKKEYMCMKCKNIFTLQASFQLHYVISPPSHCPVTRDCNSRKFVSVTRNEGSLGPKKCKDYQEIKIQEQVRKLAMGTIPRSITVVLEDDLVDCCKAGDDVTIFGYVSCRWQNLTAGKPCDLELVLTANHIEVCNDQHSEEEDCEDMEDEFTCFWALHADKIMTARNHILASLCPQMYGLYVVKLAVALILAGGVARSDSSGSRVRGECHLLLVGDPGTGKSQFLKYVAKITPRSVLTTGIGSSTAGLTVSAIRDGPHWSLEAGALVLADGGICCIDEFAGIKEHDRSAIHEAMEQQTISVAKAGLVCKLYTRASIFAATNPKLGKYDEGSSVSVNVAMASPLLSRFDLILVLLDGKNLHWDNIVADYLLQKEDKKESSSCEGNLWSLSQMQAYFCKIRKFNPVLSVEADTILKAYYQRHRQSNMRNAARTTIRLLESLIRLSEAHARLMFRKTVTIQDAVASITVVESSMQSGALLPTGSILHSCFPQDAEIEHEKHSRLVLKCLDLEELLKPDTQVNSKTNLQSCSFNPSQNNNNGNFYDVEGNSTQNKKRHMTFDLPTQMSGNELLGSFDCDSGSMSIPCEVEPCFKKLKKVRKCQIALPLSNSTRDESEFKINNNSLDFLSDPEHDFSLAFDFKIPTSTLKKNNTTANFNFVPHKSSSNTLQDNHNVFNLQSNPTTSTSRERDIFSPQTLSPNSQYSQKEDLMNFDDHIFSLSSPKLLSSKENLFEIKEPVSENNNMLRKNKENFDEHLSMIPAIFNVSKNNTLPSSSGSHIFSPMSSQSSKFSLDLFPSDSAVDKRSGTQENIHNSLFKLSSSDLDIDLGDFNFNLH